MSIHHQQHEECFLCGDIGEVVITPYGQPDAHATSFGCPVCIQRDRDEAERERDQLRNELKVAQQAIAAAELALLRGVAMSNTAQPPVVPVADGCGACGDGCKGQKNCRVERESPPTVVVPDGMIAEIEQCAMVMRYIGSTDTEDIESDTVEIIGDDEHGREARSDISIVEWSERTATLLDKIAAEQKGCAV